MIIIIITIRVFLFIPVYMPIPMIFQAINCWVNGADSVFFRTSCSCCGLRQHACHAGATLAAAVLGEYDYSSWENHRKTIGKWRV